LGDGVSIGAWQIGVASMTGALLSARLFIGLIGAPIAGTLSDRVGSRWGLLAASFAIGAIGIILMPLPNSIALILGTIICAISSGSVQSLTTALVGDLAHRHEHGKSLSLFNNAGDLGSALGPLIAYALIPFTGLMAMYVGCALMMFGVALWAIRANRIFLG
jgi:MFS family permease